MIGKKLMDHLRNIFKRFSKEEIVSCFAIPVALGILALFIRAPGLGKWCITLDEFYYSQPVSFILEKGIPELPGGGYYTRGILLQYLTVLPVLVFEKWEFAIRLLPLVFGCLTISLYFMVSKLFLPTIPALLSSIIILLSSWHIEFSRFARFYTPFQFLFFLFIFLFYKGYWQNRRRYQVLSWFTAFLSVFVYEGAIFLPFIMLLGLLIDDPLITMKKRNIELFLVSAILLFINYFINYDWWFLEVKNAMPLFISSSISEYGSKFPIELPNLNLLYYVLNHWETAISYFLLIIAAVIILFMKIRKKHPLFLNVTITIALGLGLLHLYTLAIFFLIIIFLSREDIKAYFFEHKLLWIFYYLLTLSYWLIIISVSGNMDKVMHYLIGYPPIKKTIIVPLYENVPLWGLFILFPFLISILSNLLWKRTQPKFILIVALYLVIILPEFKTLWSTTRYIFFFFPIFILIMYSEINALIEKMNDKYHSVSKTRLIHLFVFLPFILFIYTEDFNIYHVFNVSSVKTNFRMGEYEKLSDHWYPRVDLENPGKYVNSMYIDGDIVVLDDVIMSRYIKVPYVNYVNIEDHIRFPYHSRNEGRTEKWSGRALLFNTEAFAELIPKMGNNSLWLVSSLVGGFIGTSFVQKSHTPQEIGGKYNLSVDLKYTGIDKRIGVWQFKNKK